MNALLQTALPQLADVYIDTQARNFCEETNMCTDIEEMHDKNMLMRCKMKFFEE